MNIGIELKLKSEYFADRLSHPFGSSVEESTSGVADNDAVFDEYFASRLEKFNLEYPDGRVVTSYGMVSLLFILLQIIWMKVFEDRQSAIEQHSRGSHCCGMPCQKCSLKDVDSLSGCVSPQRGWEYDEMLDPEFNRFWKDVDDVRLVSEISESVSSPKAVGPRFALDPRNIDSRLFIERRLPESLICLAQIIYHICVRFERTIINGDLFLALKSVPTVEEKGWSRMLCLRENTKEQCHRRVSPRLMVRRFLVLFRERIGNHHLMKRFLVPFRERIQNQHLRLVLLHVPVSLD